MIDHLRHAAVAAAPTDAELFNLGRLINDHGLRSAEEQAVLDEIDIRTARMRENRKIEPIGSHHD